MTNEPIQRKVWDVAEPYYPKHDWAHGISHVQRVARMAVEIGREEGANTEIIEIAAILHDIFQNKERRSSSEGFRHEVEASKEASKILKELGFADETVSAVCHCIESHRKRARRIEPKTIEAKCLFDADKLDCIGAIGLVRSAFVSFDHGQEFFRDEDIEAYKRRNVRPDGTIIDSSAHSSNLEYELSLKAVAARMHTKTGKKLAKERAAFMDEFYNRLGKELRGVM